MPNGLPVFAVLFNSCFALLSYMGVQKGSGQVFTYFSQMTSIAGLLTWFGICVTYLRFYKGLNAQGYDRSELPYYSKLQPFAAWSALCSISIIMLVSPFLPIYQELVKVITLLAAEWVGGLPPRTLGHLYLYHQLLCPDFLPLPVLRCQILLPRRPQATVSNGLYFEHQ